MLISEEELLIRLGVDSQKVIPQRANCSLSSMER
jgi:hypothetical protein